ncbi:hypothetical protein ABW21_db0201758 [Orbilia brochopaga]|nr:hypothetical protein ABW21_db0201758 [Drechslerella brochopaga]
MGASQQMRDHGDDDIANVHAQPNRIPQTQDAADPIETRTDGSTGIQTEEITRLGAEECRTDAPDDQIGGSVPADKDSGARRDPETAPKPWPALFLSREVPWQGVRDHLALERTFLGWLRTSGTFAMTGVLLAQVAVIVSQNQQMEMKSGAATSSTSSSAPTLLPINETARGLSAVTVIMALVIILTGVFRFYRGQQALLDGKGISGGWSMLGLGVTAVAYLSVLFIMLVLSSDPE